MSTRPRLAVLVPTHGLGHEPPAIGLARDRGAERLVQVDPWAARWGGDAAGWGTDGCRGWRRPHRGRGHGPGRGGRRGDGGGEVQKAPLEVVGRAGRGIAGPGDHERGRGPGDPPRQTRTRAREEVAPRAVECDSRSLSGAASGQKCSRTVRMIEA